MKSLCGQPAQLEAHIDKLRDEGYSNATVNRKTQVIGQAFKVAIRNKQVNASPFIPRLSEIGNTRRGFFETADFERVLAHLPEYLRDFCRFGFITGWRKGSIAYLRWPVRSHGTRQNSSTGAASSMIPAAQQARNMIASGVPQVVAMGITGHRTTAVFQRYCTVSEEQKREAMAKTRKYVADSAVQKVVSMRVQ